ncbi:putative Fe-S oxidoreductase homolog to Magnesium-protoporphyrin IX monomethyl ester (oxidative) cyclase [Bradyrhizobium sp. ORS 285]|uniref:TIGR04295 family B12-binding domain-containing radical SAM protein n=1 Tax=Bradyrhizobium sp. ORS 285 TaxID=115808 RepID=UPI0002405BBE|nr:TIGR04295 family B12-binding domain-containing radical SAM protein [Bradyrhizobium sp. ORS 285]CCD85389.1 putative Fe-S oxidoreductase homolog to Magnesium-protoporphyrin IX monomethyl ester (oxidative) cyclase [Bradyrhizobium sp. ORS 285]SMX60022.1 putative Fe-S oxidoreductase homolog to Magnesium-protoporphyrin IX monomethyl ester (oxidative) cyclase [Bradyrhizobium sp. ORS 285]
MTRVALINPNWTFDGSIYFGCRSPHLPIELGISEHLLRQAGHATLLLDAHMFDLSPSDILAELAPFRPDMIVLTTAPTYLFWRCAPPELRVPQELVLTLRESGAVLVAVGPHGSTTPRMTLRKLGVDVVVMGECEHSVLRLANGERDFAGICFTAANGDIVLNGGPQTAAFTDQPALQWPEEMIRRHHHHHHRFEATPVGPGAEVEASRGCPYHCTFCAKDNFRNAYRKRPPAVILDEVDRLRAQGVEYVYFIDEIFLPNAELLQGLVTRGLKFGVQTRIDLWKPEMLELLGRAGCVSIEAGIESLTPEGRAALAKNCRMTTEQLADRLVEARRHVPFVQANLIEMPQDDDPVVQRWRQRMQDAGVWANDPVPLYPYPGSPDYQKLWGAPDDQAWERAHAHYLTLFSQFSDVQNERPIPLPALELQVAP